ncbi:MAG: sialidase family protein [Phycisphaerales bacterium]
MSPSWSTAAFYVNACSQGGYSRHRLTASEIRGCCITGQVEFDYNLIDPQVGRARSRYSAMDGRRLAKSAPVFQPQVPDQRERLHVRSSFDESLTWNEGKMIVRSFGRHSDLVALNDGKIGVLYEWGIRRAGREVR